MNSGVWSKGVPLSLYLSFTLSQDGNDVHLISHLDNRAIASRANDVLREIRRRLETGMNYSARERERCCYLIIEYVIFSLSSVSKITSKCRAREPLLTYRTRIEILIALTDKDFDVRVY